MGRNFNRHPWWSHCRGGEEKGRKCGVNEKRKGKKLETISKRERPKVRKKKIDIIKWEGLKKSETRRIEVSANLEREGGLRKLWVWGHRGNSDSQ